MLPEEPINNHDGRLVDVFLVETRSQSGFSGSPVFVYHEKTTVSVPIREFKNYKQGTNRVTLKADTDFGYRLLGIDSGHIPNYAIVTQRDERGVATRRPHSEVPDAVVELGSGMMGVVPAWKLASLLNSKKLRELRINCA